MKTKHLAPAVAAAFLLFTAPTRAGEPIHPGSRADTGQGSARHPGTARMRMTFNAEDQDVTVNGSRNKVTIKGNVP